MSDKIVIEGAAKVTIDGGDQETAAKAGTWDGETVAGIVVKSSAAQRYTLTVAYPANKADEAQAADGHRDFSGPEAVEKAAWSFLANSPAIGLYHAEGTDGAGTVVESYVYRGPDWVVKAANDSEWTVKAGDWMVGTVWSPDAWDRIERGEIGGQSMQGKARRAKPSAEKIAALRS